MFNLCSTLLGNPCIWYMLVLLRLWLVSATTSSKNEKSTCAPPSRSCLLISYHSINTRKHQLCAGTNYMQKCAGIHACMQASTFLYRSVAPSESQSPGRSHCKSQKESNARGRGSGAEAQDSQPGHAAKQAAMSKGPGGNHAGNGALEQRLARRAPKSEATAHLLGPSNQKG
jgi:hypothetical protein